MQTAFDEASPYPAPSQAGVALTNADAYRIQKNLVGHCLENDTIGGFKAALTAPVAQQAMGATEPITGVLFGSGMHAVHTPVTPPAHRRLLIETELGFQLDSAVSEPVTYDSVRHLVSACMPTIELAHMGFGDARPTGTDLICANSASGGYLMGASSNAREHDLNDIEVTLTKDGEILHRAVAGDVMQDQWSALTWLINTVIAQGYTIDAGALLMTGSIGAMHPGMSGHYLADYGALGSIAFDIH